MYNWKKIFKFILAVEILMVISCLITHIIAQFCGGYDDYIMYLYVLIGVIPLVLLLIIIAPLIDKLLD